MVDRLQAVLDMATSGNMQEMDKAWGLLNGMGITWDDVEKGSTWEVLSKMLGAYHAAGADGVNELEPAMQQIFGKRQMAAIRKIGDGTEMQSQFTVSCLYNLVNSRLIAEKSMIISTNVRKEELLAKYTDRITSRLFGEFEICVFAGKDIRSQKLMRK
jgi:hypothetical protein